MLIVGRRLMYRQTVVGTDEVIAHYPLPKGCEVRQIDLQSHLISTEEEVDVRSVVFYGMAGYVVPVLDPDTPETTVDLLWDQMIPKDVDISSGFFDIDTQAVDTNPEFEFGGPVDPAGLFGVAINEPLEIFRRRKMISVASSPAGYQQVAAAVDVWLPMEHFATKIKRRVKAMRHSHIMFGVSAPLTTNTTITLKAGINEQEWLLMTYMETFLEKAWISMIGLVEAGAETPYVDIANFVAELLEDTAHEDVAGGFKAVAWNVFTSSTFQVEVPGRFEVGAISSE